MVRIAVDADMQAKLTQGGGLVEICDQSGRFLGYFTPDPPPGRLKELSPYSDEDLERFRREGKGRPLAEIWKDLERRYGK